MLSTNRKRVSQKGFTFTEILIVLAIIAGVTVLVLSQAGTVIESGTVRPRVFRRALAGCGCPPLSRH